MTPTVRYIDLFAGIGGFPLGLEMASEALGVAFQGVGYSEVDKWAIETYERHYDHPNLGDITTLEPSTMPEYDLLLAGFPCQPFSSAGDGAGFADARGTMFGHVARILRDTRPQNFILENVEGLLSNDGGRSFSTIIGILTSLGYCVEWQLLDSADHGVPQSRPRVFILGYLGGPPRLPVFPFTDRVARKVDGDPKRSRYDERVFDTPVPDSESDILLTRTGVGARDAWIYLERQVSSTVDASYGAGAGDHGDRTMVGRIENRVLTLRHFTPLECERIMTFPEGWTEGQSDAQRYKQLGNAVIPLVVRDISLKMFADLAKTA